MFRPGTFQPRTYRPLDISITENNHYENTPMQYTAIFTAVKITISSRFFLLFSYFCSNIYCGYTLEPPLMSTQLGYIVKKQYLFKMWYFWVKIPLRFVILVSPKKRRLVLLYRHVNVTCMHKKLHDYSNITFELTTFVNHSNF